MRDLFSTVLGAFSSLLGLIHDTLEPVFGVHAWGWSIIGLTIIVRIGLLPLAIKQTRSMKAVQRLNPQMKALQEKYKTDRELMRRDPETYRARKAKLNEEMMALYQREGANPAMSCLPLLAQAPVFLALFWTLRDEAALRGAPFYFFTEATPGGLEKLVSAAGWPGWLLIIIMSGTMFWSSRQMMARNAAQMADSPLAQQQKILLYVMPLFLAVISFQFPLGILLYWVTTNIWQIAQQAVILRESTPAAKSSGGPGAVGTAADSPTPRRSGSATSGKPARARETAPDEAEGAAATPTSEQDPSETDDTSTDVENSSNGGGGKSGTGPGENVAPRAASGPSAGRRDRLPRRGGGR